MANFPNFLKTPDGCSFNMYRIGGVKAVETGYVLLGTSPDELLTYVETSSDVAVAWRDATVHVLTHHRPNRPLQQIDWASIAVEADPVWAAENGWLADESATGHAESGSVSSARPVAPAAPQPRRRTAEGEEA